MHAACVTMYEVKYPPWTGAANVAFRSLLDRCKSALSRMLSVTYFLHKTKMPDGCFMDCHRALFGCSIFAHIVPPRTSIDAPDAWEVWRQFSNRGGEEFMKTVLNSSV